MPTHMRVVRQFPLNMVLGGCVTQETERKPKMKEKTKETEEITDAKGGALATVDNTAVST